jgi:hypothetical protein
MTVLVEDRFILLGGPPESERDILHIVTAPSEQAIRDRLADNPWSMNGMLTIKSIERWTILLDDPDLPRLNEAPRGCRFRLRVFDVSVCKRHPGG